MKRSSFDGWALALAAIAGAPIVSQAQEGRGTDVRALEEVVVTAQRRQETVQDIPIAVSAFDSAQIERLGLQNTLEIGRLVPNMTSTNNSGLGTANAYSIRGLNNTESIATFDPPVGTYVNDVYITRQNANNFSLLDVERIEVLRGPQGTLFGRNTTGGAINVIMRRPSDSFGGWVEAGFGRFDRRSIRGTLDIPVSEVLLTKVSGYWVEDDGYVDNLTTGQSINSDDNRGVRLDVRILPSDLITWDLAFDYVDQDYANMLASPRGSGRVSNSGLRTDRSLADAGVTVSGRKGQIGLGNFVRSSSITSHLEVVTPVGDIELITGYRDMSQRFMLDFLDVPLPFGGFVIANDGSHRQFTQEIKLSGADSEGRLRYVAGFFYLEEQNRTDFADVVVGTVFIDRVMRNSAEAWAVYGQLDYAFAERWTLTAGLRYTDERKDISFTPNDTPAVFQFSSDDLDSLGVPRRQSIDLWTPRFALDYEFSDFVSAYVSATRGFKSGGWNARVTNPGAAQPFAPERVWSYEAGLKSELLERRLRLNITGFWSEVADFQIPTGTAVVLPDGGSTIAFLTGNFADLRVRGVELEALAAISSRLTAFVNVGVSDGDYRALSPEVVQQQQDCQAGIGGCGQGIVTPQGGIARPARLPDYTLVIGADYVWPLMGDRLELVPSFYVTRYGKHTINTPDDPISQVGAYNNLNVSLTLSDQQTGWSARIDCTNCTNSDQLRGSLAGQQYFNLPRMWNASVRYRF